MSGWAVRRISDDCTQHWGWGFFDGKSWQSTDGLPIVFPSRKDARKYRKELHATIPERRLRFYKRFKVTACYVMIGLYLPPPKQKDL